MRWLTMTGISKINSTTPACFMWVGFAGLSSIYVQNKTLMFRGNVGGCSVTGFGGGDAKMGTVHCTRSP